MFFAFSEKLLVFLMYEILLIVDFYKGKHPYFNLLHTLQAAYSVSGLMFFIIIAFV